MAVEELVYELVTFYQTAKHRDHASDCFDRAGLNGIEVTVIDSVAVLQQCPRRWLKIQAKAEIEDIPVSYLGRIAEVVERLLAQRVRVNLWVRLDPTK